MSRESLWADCEHTRGKSFNFSTRQIRRKSLTSGLSLRKFMVHQMPFYAHTWSHRTHSAGKPLAATLGECIDLNQRATCAESDTRERHVIFSVLPLRWLVLPLRWLVLPLRCLVLPLRSLVRPLRFLVRPLRFLVQPLRPVAPALRCLERPLWFPVSSFV